uniref:Uncharacterized protein n=1 Tax=Rhizophora mucronata TaxID=61149 RepID=A0A2P2MGA1_RHIMU
MFVTRTNEDCVATQRESLVVIRLFYSTLVQV